MLSSPKLVDSMGNPASYHYLGRILGRIPLPFFWAAALIGLCAYVIFCLFAVITDWKVVSASFLHIWQISFSFTIFLGFWFGQIGLNDVKRWITHIEQTLQPEQTEFRDWIKDTLLRLGSPWSSMFALPFIIPGTIIAFMIGQNSPNLLFPFSGYSPVFIYAVFIELCVFMLHLLSATGYWILFTLTLSARKLSQLSSINYNLVDAHSLHYLSNIILKLCFMLLVIIASAMPGVAYVVFWFKNIPLSLFLGTVFAMVLPTLALALSFFGPTYYLHVMLVAAKERRILNLKEGIYLCEEMLQKRVKELSLSDKLRIDPNDENLLKLINHFRERLVETQNEPDWPFNLSSFLKLSGSSMLPVVAFFAQEMVRRVFP